MIDHRCVSSIVCPYCGDSWDPDEAVNPCEDEPWKCEECGRTFLLDVEYSVSYSTRKAEEGKCIGCAHSIEGGCLKEESLPGLPHLRKMAEKSGKTLGVDRYCPAWEDKGQSGGLVVDAGEVT